MLRNLGHKHCLDLAHAVEILASAHCRPTILEFSGAPLLARPLQRRVGRNCTRERSATVGARRERNERQCCAATRTLRRRLMLSRAIPIRTRAAAEIGPQKYAGARVCPPKLSRHHRRRQCAGTTLKEVGNRETKTGRCRWPARSRALSAFERHGGRPYEQLLMFPAALDRKTTPANERTAIDARPKVGVSDG